MLRGFEDHAAAVASIAARRPAARHIFLAAKGDAAVAAVAGLYVNLGFVNKHDSPVSKHTTASRGIARVAHP